MSGIKEEKKLKFAYYPGCVIFGTGKEYHMSALEVAKALGIELVEIPDWNCCGASVADSFDKKLFFLLQARNIALAEKAELDIVAICNECFNNLKQANKKFKEDSALRERINMEIKDMGLEVKGALEVRHFLDVIYNDIGIESIRKKIKKENVLSGVKIAPYYGCLALRPHEISIDAPENPTMLENLFTALGAKVVKFGAHKTACCGSSVLLMQEEVGLKLSFNIIKSAKEAGADCVVTMCPLCHLNLDLRQKTMEKKYSESLNVPMVYFTQLLGLALGIEPKKLGLDKNIVSAKKVIENVV